jgi:hypothetical protein
MAGMHMLPPHRAVIPNCTPVSSSTVLKVREE